MKRKPPIVKMKTLADEYLAHRRKLGFQMKIEGEELLRFARYADEAGHPGWITTDLAVRWSKLSALASPLYWARRLDIVRRFSKYRALFDPRTEIPPSHLLGPSYRRPTPYIYSEQEIDSLLQTTSRLGPKGGLRPRTYTTLFGLLASTGLRISEALKLDQSDVNWGTGILTIRESKFHKSRLVPLHPTTQGELRAYACARDRYHPMAVGTSQAFFLTEKASRLKYHKTIMTFCSIRREIQWRKQDPASNPPRIHDLRHSFAVTRLKKWYEEGVNIDHRIAWLSTYLGHVKPADTYWYLSAVPELLAVTSSRFERFAEATRQKGGFDE